LVWDLDEAIKEVKLLGKHGEEANQKIMELEALWSSLMMSSSWNSPISMDTTTWMRLLMMRIRMTTTEETPPHPATAPPPIPTPPTATPEVIVIEEENPVEMVPEQEAPEVHEVILADAEPELPQPW
jgi:hypothetical protein